MRISVLIPTYGRPELLEEAIEGFLRQTYTDCDLEILNDRAEQTLVYDHPRVHITNVIERFNSTGIKRKAQVESCKNEWIMFWDDDDICLPWHIEDSIDRLKYFLKNDLSRADTQWLCTANEKLEIMQARYVHTILMKKKHYIEVGGHSDKTRDEDFSLLRKLLKRQFLAHTKLPKYRPAYMHRVSMGRARITDYSDDAGYHKERLDHVKKDADLQNVNGVIHLNPHWNKDYIAMHEVAYGAL